MIRFVRGGEALGGRLQRLALAHQIHDALPDGVGVQARVIQGTGGHALALPGQAQQQMLRTHVSVAQLRRGGLRQLKGLLGPLRKTIFIHNAVTSISGAKARSAGWPL